MLVVDEAQGLVKINAKGKNDWQAFEWLRSLAEGGEFGIAVRRGRRVPLSCGSGAGRGEWV